MIGNLPDAPMLAPAIARLIGRFGRAPRSSPPSPANGEAAVEADLRKLKVREVAIPRKGKPGVPGRRSSVPGGSDGR